MNENAIGARIPLCHLPTPLEPLPSIGRFSGGRNIWIKRDDCTGLGLGGNKTRKLEYLCHAALSAGADILVTAGDIQSNHCRQTAAAAARCGLECLLLLGGEDPGEPQGNLLLDTLFGARIEWCGSDRKGEGMDRHAERLIAEGRTPYVVPYSGSGAVGALGYVAAMAEMIDQARNAGIFVSTIITASSSGGTQAGLAVGARACGYEGKIIGISVDRRSGEGFEEDLALLANHTARLVEMEAPFTSADFTVEYGYIGEGYARPDEEVKKTISLFASREAVLLDPVYTGRAAMALLDMKSDTPASGNDTVLFWHTGGVPSLFAWSKIFA